MKTYHVELTGEMPLLMHADDLNSSERIKEWRNSLEGKKNSVAGDDRSPAWTWISYCYQDGKRLVMPTDNIMRCMMEAGAMVPNGGKKTFKSQTQSGCMPGEMFWNFKCHGREISWSEIQALWNEKDFQKHQDLAAKLGFSLFVKRAKIGQAKHVRVRPRFENWSASGTLTVTDDQLTQQVLERILQCAGRYKGLGDWRPGCKTPGPHGMFTVQIKAA